MNKKNINLVLLIIFFLIMGGVFYFKDYIKANISLLILMLFAGGFLLLNKKINIKETFLKKIKLNKDRKLKIVETISLGSGTRIMILEFNKNEYLISQTNNGIQILEKPKFKKETKKAKLMKTKDKEKKTVQSKLDSLIKRKANYIGVASLLLIILLIPDISYAQSIDLTSIKSNSSFLQIFLLITFLSVAPAILLMMTPFTRIAISLSLLKQAMGIPAIPSNQIIAGLAIFLTFFIMRPEVENLSKKVIEPYSNGAIDYKQALSKGSDIMKQFMYKHVRKIDLENFVKLSKIKNTKEVPMSILIPAFVTSELKTAFQIGILIYIPFLLIDLIVSSVLMSMGMIMIPPAMISLPLKLLIFVLVDGWNLITSGLVRSFGV